MDEADFIEDAGGDDDNQDLTNGYITHFSYDYEDRNLGKSVACLFNVPQMSDVTFMLYDENETSKMLKPIFAHRFVLSSCSPYFRELFGGPLYGTNSCKIMVNGIRFKHFVHIIRYIYVGWVEDTFPMDEASDFYRAVKCLKLEHMFHWQLRSWLMNSIRQRTESAISIYIACFEHNFIDIRQECLCAMTDTPRDMFDDVDFNLISLPGMQFFVQCNRMNCTKHELIEAVKEWIEENADEPDEGGKVLLLQTVLNTHYEFKGKRYRLRLEPGIAASLINEEGASNSLGGDRVSSIQVFNQNKNYNFVESCQLQFDESIFMYGVVILFGRHRNYDERFVESIFCGQFEIKFGEHVLVNAMFKETIKFSEQTYASVEIFFPKAALNYDHEYTFEVNWRSVGAYPDIITFDVHRSWIKANGNGFISEMFYENQFD